MTNNQGFPNPYPHPDVPPTFVPSQAASPVAPNGPASHAAIPPKKVWFKRWWVIAIIAFLALGVLFSLIDPKDDTAAPAAVGSPSPSVTVSATADASRLAAEKQRLAEEEAARQEEARAAASASAAARASAEASASAAAAEASAAAAEASAAAEAALTDPSTYSKISRRDWQLIEKDPDSHAGAKYIIYGHVTQADAATGTTVFRANTGGVDGDWYDFDINTIVMAKPEIVATVVTDDLVKMYVTVTGAYTYDTQVGGSTTAVAVVASIVENTGSSND